MELEDLKPCNDLIIVRPLKTPEREGQIILPRTGERPLGEILSVGPGVLHKGERTPPAVEVGQTVLLRSGRGFPFRINGEEVLFMGERDFLAVIK